MIFLSIDCATEMFVVRTWTRFLSTRLTLSQTLPQILQSILYYFWQTHVSNVCTARYQTTMNARNANKQYCGVDIIIFSIHNNNNAAQYLGKEICAFTLRQSRAAKAREYCVSRPRRSDGSKHEMLWAVLTSFNTHTREHDDNDSRHKVFNYFPALLCFIVDGN